MNDIVTQALNAALDGKRVIWLCDNRTHYLARMTELVDMAHSQYRHLPCTIRRGSPAVITIRLNSYDKDAIGRVTFVSTLNAMRGQTAELAVIERDQIDGETRLHADLVVGGVGGEVIEVAS